MKQVSQLVIAAILGSVITLGAYKAFTPKASPVTNVNQDTPSRLTNYNAPQSSLVTPQALAPNGVPTNFTVAAAKTMPAVVHIQSTVNRQTASRSQKRPMSPFDFFFDQGNPFDNQQDSSPQSASGSGVIISQDGYIVTNNHVIDGASEIEVSLYNKQSYTAEVIGTDPSTDLALIKIKDSNLPMLTLANSDNAQVGEWVLAVGNPFNLASTVTAGIVSAKGRNINILKDQAAIESFIQTDAAVNPGNSGGALVNIKGDLLGINTAIATPTGTYAGYSFAVPANIVKKVIEDLKKHGVVQRAFLGVMIRDVDGKLAEELDLAVTRGVYVNELMESGSAIDAGIKPGDVITKVDGVAVNSAPELQEQIGRHRPGDKVKVTLNSKGKEKDIFVVLKNKSGNTDVIKKNKKSAVFDVLGADFSEVEANQLEKMRISGGVKINKLYNGKLREQTDIREGFIITKVNDRSVKNLREFTQEIQNRTGGILLEGLYPNSNTTYFYGFGL